MADNEEKQRTPEQEREEEIRKEAEMRKFLDSLDMTTFGIITQLGYRELMAKFETHAANARNLGKMVIVGMLVQLLVIIYVFYTDYHGRNIALTAARQGCERDKLDRNAEAKGWRIAQDARIIDKDFEVAAQYDDLADGLILRGAINCNELYPRASLLP